MADVSPGDVLPTIDSSFAFGASKLICVAVAATVSSSMAFTVTKKVPGVVAATVSSTMAMTSTNRVSGLVGATVNSSMAFSVGLRLSHRVHAAINSSFSFAAYVPGAALTLASVIDEVFAMWGVDCRTATDSQKQQAVSIVNNAMQQMFARAKERQYFASKEFDTSMGVFNTGTDIPQDNISGTTSIPLQALSSEGITVHSTLGPLRRLTTRQEYETFEYIHPELAASVLPTVFYVDTSRIETDQGLALVLWFKPNTGDSQDIRLRISYLAQPPYYTWADHCLATRIALPHRYVESLLLPLVKYEAMSSFWFKPGRGGEFSSAAVQERFAACQRLLDPFDPIKTGARPDQEGRQSQPSTTSGGGQRS